ncbi:MAG TPA: imidazolonepropionase [Vicinamibacterales bacterium]|nr:imidazolonepropionase [Vicinamibacterales bacterium]
MRPVADFLIEHADLIATATGSAPKRGAAQRELLTLRDSIIASRDGVIVYVGPSAEAGNSIDISADATRVDAAGCTVVPGFVDPHTHVVYAGNRDEELRRRLSGATYEEIAAAGGGILSTMNATRAASETALVEAARARLDAMVAAGTTTCEIKSGYGLTTDSELTQLRAIRQLDVEHPIDIVPTFLGAHDVPPECRSRRLDYISTIVDEMIPRVAEERLAAWCDVFCDRGYFSPEESITILEAGSRAGLRPRLHADELASSGGCRVAAAVGARSADHLVHVSESDADALASANVCATLLPTAAFYLKLGRFAPARMLIEHGVSVAIATDVNPGGGLSPSMPFAIALACFGMHMTLEEALVAATVNAAWSLDVSDRVGSLEPGKLMDAVIVRSGLTELLRVGTHAIRCVVKRGSLVVDAH